MNGILLIDVTCDFLKFDRCKMLNGYVDFTFKILSFRMTVAQSKHWKIEDDLNKTWITSNSLYFLEPE